MAVSSTEKTATSASVVVGYSQMPMVPWILAHLAPPVVSHSLSLLQINPQYLLPDWSWMAHCGWAVTPEMTSVGQEPLLVHLGKHADPSKEPP